MKLEGFSRAINQGSAQLRRSLPGLLAGVFKANAVLLFLWYGWEFLNESWGAGRQVNYLIGFTLALSLFFGAFIFGLAVIRGWQGGEPHATPRENGWMYVLLVLVPVVAVALVHLVQPPHHFKSPLLYGTAKQIDSLVK